MPWDDLHGMLASGRMEEFIPKKLYSFIDNLDITLNFVCWPLFPYPFHPHISTLACRRSWSFCQNYRCQVAAKHACTQHMWFQMKWHCKLVHGCMMYTEHVPRWQQLHMALSGHQYGGYIFFLNHKRIQSLIQNHMQHECNESAQEQRIALYKSNQ